MKLSPYPPISDYGLIGNGHTVALVSSSGGIDWWCPERFDDEAVFSRLLDWEKGGHFSIYSKGSKEFSYLPNTNILQTVYRTSEGLLRIFTFMPYDSQRKEIIRVLKCERGKVNLEIDLKITKNFGTEEIKEEEGVYSWDGKQIIFFSTLKISDKTCYLEAGEEAVYILQNGDQKKCENLLEYAHQQLEQTKEFWESWIGKCNYEGYAEGLVKRSILCLKLLQYKKTGALVAAPTSSLPEYPSGERNWDYRFSWIRDGVFIVMAFETLGYVEEADDFREWLTDTLFKHKTETLQMFYSVDGGEGKNEDILNLEGYKKSKPVRVGNSASSQRQIDTYGEAMLCYHRAKKIFEGPLREKAWNAIRCLLDDLEQIWKKPDASIWEVQGDEQQFLYSKAVTHLAFDHAVSICETFGLDGPVEKWRKIAEEAKAIVGQNFRKDINSFSATIGQKDVDGASLLFAILGIFEYKDERMIKTVQKIKEELEVHNMIFRNLNFKNFDNPEGAFSPVTFWMCQVEAKQGQLKQAQERFSNLVQHTGTTCLMSEECEPVTREMWGNYPQALTHLSLILAAWAINDEMQIKNSNH